MQKDLQKEKERIEKIFDYYLNYFDVLEDGTCVETRKEVGRIDGLKVEMFSNDHPPPHFHVTCPDFSARFTIDNCGVISGNVDSKIKKKIKNFYDKNRDLLTQYWINTRHK